MEEIKDILRAIKQKISQVKKFCNFPKLKEELSDLEQEILDENFWSDRAKAEQITQKISDKRRILDTWNDFGAESREIEELLDIINSRETEEIKELKRQAISLEKKIKEKEIEVFLSGEYDRNNVIISIFAGTGGTDAQDWAEILLRMYLRYFEKKNFKSKIIQKSPGEEAGIKSIDLEVKGEFAYGLLKCEKGVHRLVRLSPFNAKNLRQTSFAQVMVIPVISQEKSQPIDPSEIRIDVFRSKGAGGQSVNTTDSAVRITHLPTNITVSCQNERSQLQNKETCLKILRGRLFELQEKERAKKIEENKGEIKETSWGNQIRSYVMHPYKLVKDLRTNFESKDIDSVLDGNIDDFIDQELRR